MKGNEQTGLTHFRVYTLVIYRIGVRLLLVFHRRFAEASGMVQVIVLTLLITNVKIRVWKQIRHPSSIGIHRHLL